MVTCKIEKEWEKMVIMEREFVMCTEFRWLNQGIMTAYYISNVALS
jgi:hypothetical protein